MQWRVIACNTDGENDGRDNSGNHSSGHGLRTKLSWDVSEKENIGMENKYKRLRKRSFRPSIASLIKVNVTVLIQFKIRIVDIVAVDPVRLPVVVPEPLIIRLAVGVS